MSNQHTQGVYPKFLVSRRDGRDFGNGDRKYADYFVLDLTYDPYALIALKAYVEAVKAEYPLLAKDLSSKIEKIKNI